MLTFALAISCLTTSNLPWFMDLTFQVPMQYCSLQHGTLLLLPVTSTAGYCICFGSIPSLFLELFLHWPPVAFWAPTDLGSTSFWYPIILPFHTVHGVLKARILKWLAIPFSSGPHSVRPFHHDPPVLGCPTGMAWFLWVKQAVVLVWLDWLVFCEYGFSVSALNSVYSFHLFLISSASVRSLQFLSFIVPIFAWNFPWYLQLSWRNL